MKVVYVNADRGIPVFGDKGAAVHVREMAAAFNAIGCDLRILATRLGEGDPGSLAGQVEQIHPQPGALDVGRSAARDEKERRLIELGHAMEERLVALYAEWPFDMIYERYSLWSSAGVDAGGRLGVPAIVEVNAPLIREQTEYRNLALIDEAERIEERVFGRATGLAVVSSALRAYAMSRGAAAHRVQVLGNAVDPDRFHPRVAPARLEIDPDAFVIGFTGSLKKWHGIGILLEAFRLLREESAEAHLLIVGDGPKRAWAKGYAQGARVYDHVTMTGWVPHDELPGLIARMDVATAPYPPSEEFYFSPLKLYEYLAVGRPVVVSAIGQVGEVIEHDVSGLLVAPGDPEALAEGLLTLIRNPSHAAAIAAGAAVEGARHTWARNADAATTMARVLGKAA